MPPITWLLSKLEIDYPALYFRSGERFLWSPSQKTVFYPAESDEVEVLVHETAHALLDHADYKRDVKLLEMEREAWEYAQEIAKKYGLLISDNLIEEALDTYRDWLHARSTCPSCAATGLQTKSSDYRCLACQSVWRVNEARTCELRRFLTTKNTPV